ncbi:unnamed protein product [Bathycoccus prasinos]
MIFCERFECEHTCWDPKDGELCLSRAKPEETPVEARSNTDVQIVCQTWDSWSLCSFIGTVVMEVEIR